jgi:hypothetical protein
VLHSLNVGVLGFRLISGRSTNSVTPWCSTWSSLIPLFAPYFYLLAVPYILSPTWRAMHYNFARSKTALSCTQLTHTLPSFFVLISPLTFAVLLPAATTQYSTTHSVPMGTGRSYVQLSVRLTWPQSRKPGRAIVSSAVDVSVSSSVAAHPPCRLPLSLHSAGAYVKDHSVDCDSADAEIKVACVSGSASKQTDSPGGGGAVSSA